MFAALEHTSGARSHLWASAVAAAPGPRLRVLGTAAGYVAPALDGQEDALRAGRRPDQAGFGDESPEHWGRFVRGDEEEPVPSTPGRWAEFYEEVVRALRDGGAPPVDPDDAVAVLEVLDAVRRSATDGEVVAL